MSGAYLVIFLSEEFLSKWEKIFMIDTLILGAFSLTKVCNNFDREFRVRILRSHEHVDVPNLVYHSGGTTYFAVKRNTFGLDQRPDLARFIYFKTRCAIPVLTEKRHVYV